MAERNKKTDENEFNKCCVEEIQKIWAENGGSLNIVLYEGTCPKCNHYIGLTRTSEAEAADFLKKEYKVWQKETA